MLPATYRELVHKGAAHLAGAGVEDSRLEAKLLLLSLANMDSATLIREEANPVPPDIYRHYELIIRERATRRPLQHILGTTEFYSLEFLCDARALIPRPDSEIVVEAALRLIPEGKAMTVADLGTGSGCLLAAILAHRPQVRGVGVEASPQAASLARENFSRLGLETRASVFEGSWVDWPDWQSAGLIISNPPYIVRAEIGTLAPEVRSHDPVAALDGGEDGLDAYREIIALAGQKLSPGAWLVFEIGHDQKEAVSGLLEMAKFTAIGTSKDLGGNDRAVWGRKPEK